MYEENASIYLLEIFCVSDDIMTSKNTKLRELKSRNVMTECSNSCFPFPEINREILNFMSRKDRSKVCNVILKFVF